MRRGVRGVPQVGLRAVLPDEGLRCVGEVVGVVTRDQLTALTALGQVSGGGRGGRGRRKEGRAGRSLS
jgi:hypothetical protein